MRCMINNNNIPLISIVILNYNGLNYLKETIPLIKNINYKNFEIIVVDNGSSDGSVDFLNQLGQINVIKNKTNLGYGAGKNIGVDAAKGEYILMIDNDIVIKNRFILNNLLSVWNKNIGFIQVPLLDHGTSTTKYYGIFFSLYGANSHQKSINIKHILSFKERTIDIGAPTGACMFFHKSFWTSMGGFDESQPFNIDDIDIGPRAWICGFKNVLYTKDFFVHLGVNKTNSVNAYSDRFKFVFSGHARTMIKNYNIMNLSFRFPFFFIFQFLKAVKYSFKKGNIKVFLAFLNSIILFITNLKDTMGERRFIQSKRIIKRDVFLNIYPPKFHD